MRKQTKGKRSLALLLTCMFLVMTFLTPYASAAQRNEAGGAEAIQGTDYYLDSENGSDESDGTSPSGAWRTLDKLKEIVFQPGDRILFRSGSEFHGAFVPKGSGTEEAPITVDIYNGSAVGSDAGNRAVLHGDGLVRNTVFLENLEYWTVNNLEITNNGETREARAGVMVEINQEGVFDGIHLNNLYVHDVNGDIRNKSDNGGIYFINRFPGTLDGTETSRYNDISVENCHVKDVSRTGLSVGWFLNSDFIEDEYGKNGGRVEGKVPQLIERFYNTNVVIRNNYVENAGGDAIVPMYALNPLIEYNISNHACKDMPEAGNQYSAAIWPWRCINSVFQFNEAYDSVINGDGQAYDCDWSVGTTYQYNYSHDNEGGFMLVCQSQVLESVIRYNISQNDLRSIFMLSNTNMAEAYNNTIYVKPGVEIYANYSGKLNLRNNIFYSAAEGERTANWSRNGTYDHNLYYGFSNLPEDANKVVADPKFVDPGKGIDGVPGNRGIDSLSGYQLQDDSPAINAGAPIEDNGGRDYFGNPVSGIPDIGAHESGSSSLKIFSTEYAIDQAEQKISMDKKDKVTVDALLSSLRHDAGVTVRVYRGEGEIIGSTRLATGDTVKVSGNGGEAAYTVEVTDSGSSTEIPVDGITATAGSYHSGQGPEYVLDGDPGTLWHTEWEGSPREQHYITFDLGEIYQVDGLRYLPRSAGGVNGIITKYRIDVSMTGNDDDWTSVATGDWANNSEWKTVSFASTQARFVKLVSLDSVTQEAGNEYTSAAEIRLTGSRNNDDDQAPTAPANVTAADVTGSAATLSWNTSTDNVGVEGYVIKNGDTEIATVGSDLLNYTVTGLQANVEYTLSVYAFDEAGNLSEAGSVTFTTGKAGAVNKSTLKLVLDLANAHVAAGDVDKLIPTAREQFHKALAGAQSIYDNPNATQEQVDKAWKTLMNVIHALGFVPGDKTELIILVAEAKGIVLDGYEDGAEKDAFKAALQAAEDLIADKDAMKLDIDAAYKALADAMQNLIPKPAAGDKTELKKVIDEAEVKNGQLDKYVDDAAAKEAFADALQAANGMYLKDGATQDEIDGAKLGLLTAMAGLRLRADKSSLNGWLDELKAIDLSQYTAASAAIVRAVIARAEALAAQDLGEDEIERIQAMVAEMENAKAQLEKAPTEPEDPENPDDTSKPDDSKPDEENSSKEESASEGEDAADKVPTTGDSLPVALLSVMALASAGAWLLRKRKK